MTVMSSFIMGYMMVRAAACRGVPSPPLRRLHADDDSAAVIVRSAGDSNQQLQARAVLTRRGMWRQIIFSGRGVAS